jgi:hypothetical protein
VSRKFIYQQTRKASTALDEAFPCTAPDDEVLFELPVSRSWLRQVTLALTLIFRSSYRGVVEFMRDRLGVPISVGAVCSLHQWAARSRPAPSPAIRISPAFWSVCTMRSFRAPGRCSPVSMRTRLTVTFSSNRDQTSRLRVLAWVRTT